MPSVAVIYHHAGGTFGPPTGIVVARPTSEVTQSVLAASIATSVLSASASTSTLSASASLSTLTGSATISELAESRIEES